MERKIESNDDLMYVELGLPVLRGDSIGDIADWMELIAKKLRLSDDARHVHPTFEQVMLGAAVRVDGAGNNEGVLPFVMTFRPVDEEDARVFQEINNRVDAADGRTP